jgi:hypothetical protein
MEQFTDKDLRNIRMALRHAMDVIDEAAGCSFVHITNKEIHDVYSEIVWCSSKIGVELHKREAAYGK